MNPSLDTGITEFRNPNQMQAMNSVKTRVLQDTLRIAINTNKPLLQICLRDFRSRNNRCSSNRISPKISETSLNNLQAHLDFQKGKEVREIDPASHRDRVAQILLTLLS